MLRARQSTTFQRWPSQDEDPRLTPQDDGDWWGGAQARVANIARAGAAALAVSVGIAGGFNVNDDFAPTAAPAEQDSGAVLSVAPVRATVQVWGDQDEIGTPAALVGGGGGYVYNMRSQASTAFQRWGQGDEVPTAPTPFVAEDDVPMFRALPSDACATVWAGDDEIVAQGSAVVEEVDGPQLQPLAKSPAANIVWYGDEEVSPQSIVAEEDTPPFRPLLKYTAAVVVWFGDEEVVPQPAPLLAEEDAPVLVHLQDVSYARVWFGEEDVVPYVAVVVPPPVTPDASGGFPDMPRRSGKKYEQWVRKQRVALGIVEPEPIAQLAPTEIAVESKRAMNELAAFRGLAKNYQAQIEQRSQADIGEKRMAREVASIQRQMDSAKAHAETVARQIEELDVLYVARILARS